MPLKPVDYSKTIIYKIVPKDLNLNFIYIGSTTDFIRRKGHHKGDCNNENQPNYLSKIYKTIRENGGWDAFEMIEIEKYACNDGNEARTRERYWMELFNANLNSIKPIITKEEIKENAKQYSIINKDKLTQLHKEYYLKNIDKKKIYDKEQRLKNKDKITKQVKEYQLKNKDKILQKQNEYQLKNKDKILQYKKEYRLNNKEKIAQYRKEYALKKKLEKETEKEIEKNNI